ncbi:hypothetical protein CFC21_085058 [Triticum aestivum]|uniref:PGG domain-containing protein n=2 Tax=Triticum aestivum TaxID=4565 RepID=A0A9R1ID71_WHEAT|nr:uncharacterized protein LOC123128805 [Triticum aestivum]KAF7081076.1 hypothetical protein CFC21_085050 [Triticum aestivum]KAF7081084.1 hypothetical protein CFC21_085058 [Triticum aestivum]
MECGGVSAVQVQPAAPTDQPGQPAKPPVQPWEYSLRKYLLLLAALVVTVTYAAGFSPPGGVWQTAQDGQPAGDPIIRGTHYRRYLAFFYCNATAFAASLVVIVLILVLAARHDKKGKDSRWVVVPLRLVMVLDLLSLMGAYGAGTCQDKISIVYSAVLVAAIFLYVAVLKMMDWYCPDKSSDPGSGGTMTATNSNSSSGGMMSTPDPDSDAVTIRSPIRDSDPNVKEKEDREREVLKKLKADERLRKVLMLLATFAVSITYIAGLSTPGGFWDSTGASYRPGDAILKDHHRPRLTVFLLCNTTAFVASLVIIMLLIIDGKKLREKTVRSLVLYGFIVVALVSLVGAYTAGSCRETKTTIYVVSLAGGILAMAYILLYAFYTLKSSRSSPTQQTDALQQTNDNISRRKGLDKARSLVLLLATLAATITYTAGLDPPGGVWQDNDHGHMAGDPILITTNIGRYRAFYYCNSVAFVASLLVIVLVQTERLIKHHVLEAAMILDLFGLIGAYAAGSCRDVNSSIYVMALAGAALIYVVIHIVFFTLELDHKDKKDDDQEDELLEKRRKRLLLFAILAATITYQAGLTPPGGFLLQDDTLGHHAGDPILLHNYPVRYHAFFYCNSVSFMLSIALIILLVNPNLYRPAIQSNALSVCTAVGLFCLMGAYAAGSTQHRKTSIYIFVLVAVVLLIAAGLLLVFLLKRKLSNVVVAPPREQNEEERKKEVEEKNEDEEEAKKHARRKYLMLLGILVASVAYQAGLEPPGGAWQNNDNGYDAGNPVMNDNRRPRYLTFFYSNSISFVASIVVIIMLLPQWLPKKKEGEWEKWSLRVMNWMIRLDLFALLVAYAAGSNRGLKTSLFVVALIFAVLGYFAIHTVLACTVCRRERRQSSSVV